MRFVCYVECYYYFNNNTVAAVQATARSGWKPDRRQQLQVVGRQKCQTLASRWSRATLCAFCSVTNEQQFRASLLCASVDSKFFCISLDHSYRRPFEATSNRKIMKRWCFGKFASIKGEGDISLDLTEHDKQKERQHYAPSSLGRYESKQWRKHHLKRGAKPKTSNISAPPTPPESTTLVLGIETLAAVLRLSSPSVRMIDWDGHEYVSAHQEQVQQGSHSVVLYCITFLNIARLLAPVQPIIFAFLISLDLYS